MSINNKLIKIILPILIIASAFALMRILSMSRVPPERTVKENPGALVETLTVTKADHRITVRGTGTVGSRREASITPQINGIIIHISPSFTAGGFFNKGELILEIESLDYQLSIDKAHAELAKAEYDLARVESQARVARKEWNELKLETDGELNPLVVYEPQLKNAEAGVASANATLRQAELDLERTRIHAPFDCRVRTKNIDIGQYVKSGTSIGTVAGTAVSEVVVPLPIKELHWLSIPRKGTNREGSRATVKLTAGDKTFNWTGRIVRSLGEVDPQGRMTRVVVEVQDPYNITGKYKRRPDLESGMFVEVELNAKTLKKVASVPRGAIRDSSTVWVITDNETLNIRPVVIVRTEREKVFIREGLSDGDSIVLTTVPGAAEGMKLRAVNKNEENRER